MNIHDITMVSDSAATIIVTPDPAPISQNADGLRWKLTGQGGKTYAFTADGISFPAGQPSGASAPATGTAAEFVWCFGPTSPRYTSWKYTVKFYDTAASASAPVWKCDPTIINSNQFSDVSASTSVNCVPQ